MEFVLSNFYEWNKWESIMHHLLLLLIIYIVFVFLVNKKSRNLTNIILFTIVVAIEVIIHHLINVKNKKRTEYL